jgi:hypothetical protein
LLTGGQFFLPGRAFADQRSYCSRIMASLRLAAALPKKSGFSSKSHFGVLALGKWSVGCSVSAEDFDGNGQKTNAGIRV